MVYEVKYKLAPPYMIKLLSNISGVHSYNTRVSGDLIKGLSKHKEENIHSGVEEHRYGMMYL